jgi:solute carrier family 25 uncoupling protein 8/9
VWRTLSTIFILDDATCFQRSWSAIKCQFFLFFYSNFKLCFQIQGEVSQHSKDGSAKTRAVLKSQLRYRGMLHTISTISKEEGPRALWNGLTAGLQRQMCFASVRIGFYDSVKRFYMRVLGG